LVKVIFNSIEHQRSGKITRAQLRQGLESNRIESVKVLQEIKLTETNPIIIAVVRQLEESTSGFISKSELLSTFSQCALNENINISSETTENFVAAVFSQAGETD
jgi:hypothetical protein